MPRNPDDGKYLRKAIDVIDEYISGSSTRLLVICMISHRWRRPDHPHPDDARHRKAKALAKYGEEALKRNVEMYYWLDYAGVNQERGPNLAAEQSSNSEPSEATEEYVLRACVLYDALLTLTLVIVCQENERDKIAGIAKLPCIVASCNEFLVYWSDDYEARAWTRMERYIGCPRDKPIVADPSLKPVGTFRRYVFSPCSQFRVIDDRYGRPVPIEALVKSGVVTNPSIFQSAPLLQITDPLGGNLTSEEDRQHLACLVDVGKMLPPMAYRGRASKVVEFNKSTVELLCVASTRGSVRFVRDEEKGTALKTSIEQLSNDEAYAYISTFRSSAEDVFAKEVKEELILGTGCSMKKFIACNVVRSFLPVIFNGVWLAGAGIAHCGSQQSFLTYVFEFELYFMA
eukprot:2521520-Amphidinium_carterae.1